MCGLSGYLCVTGGEAAPAALLRMNRAIAHRGPDDEGYVLIGAAGGTGVGTEKALDFRGPSSPSGLGELPPLEPDRPLPHRIALGHRRFSILDPGPLGHQPFWTPGREACLTFNGEIYNYLELRAELEALGHRFRGHGDTEVLAAAFLQWGEDGFRRCNGFWAVALYDARSRRVLLARDRIGKAPLYWIRRDGRLWWSSEIKGLFAGLGTAALPIDGDVLRRFARTGNRDAGGRTFYADIRTFPAASYAWVEPDGSFRPVSYWSLPQARVPEAGPGPDGSSGPEAAVREFRSILTEAVRLRLRSDVPVAVELSGGMDSSAIAALAAGLQEGPGRIKAYTVTFPGRPEDETAFARSVAQAYPGRIDWMQVEYRPPDFFARAEGYVAHMDEPFHSPNMISNQDLWREMAKQGIKVSLNGGGGDEVLAGYASEYFGPYLVSLLRGGNLARFAREFAGFSEHDDDRLLHSYARELFHLLPEGLRLRLKPRIPAPEEDPLVAGDTDGALPEAGIEARLLRNMGDGKMNYWMRSGNLSFMQVPTEVRLPFLDHRVVECAFRLPLAYLIRDGWLKWILRRSLVGAVPDDVLWRRKKAGFPFPLRSWLADSAPRFRAFAASLDCPYVDGRTLADRYGALAAAHPDYLWRLLSIGLWWRKCVEGKDLKWE
jgi:asparagine synthase (glutamine-hydrolysing)